MSCLWLAAGPLVASSAVLFVKPTGNNANNGLSWAAAKQTVAAGLAEARDGDQVWVAAGTYMERITLKQGVGLYGGFTGSEDPSSFNLDDRDLVANRTTLDGNQGGTVVTSPSGATATCRVDGFTITRGRAAFGGGLNLSFSAPTVTNNRIVDNGASSYGGGLYASSSASVIANNTLTGNSASNYGGGMYLSSGSPTVANNVIRGNSASSGGGLYASSSNATITNNTVTGNSASQGGAITLSASAATIANTLVAFNSSGFHRASSGATPTLRYNCVYENGAYNYSGVADPTGSNGNIVADPRVTDFGYGGWHLEPNSPCIGAGNNADAYGDLDLDGQARIQPVGGTVDIGADESDGTTPVPGPHAIVHVSPLGDDSQDGSSWALAKRTVQAGIDAAAARSGEVWVQAGTYDERVTLKPLAHLYGGFAGHEQYRVERNWTANVTTLDGQQQGHVVMALNVAPNLSTIDGFVITHGTRGLSLASASPLIANSVITGNSSSGVYLTNYSAPLITNNVIAGNNVALYLVQSSPSIANNTIVRNMGFGLIVSSGSAPTVANTLVAFNAGGISSSSSTPLMRSNCVYGNSSANYSGIADQTGTDGNISVNPEIANFGYNGWHLMPNSPCVDAGDNSDVRAGTDIDGQPRVQPADGTVDIGADESDGTLPVQAHAIIRVSLLGDDSLDGSSWAQAKRTLQAAIDVAAVQSAEVWVQAGSYFERISLRPMVHLYGGFAGDELLREQRDWTVNVTLLDGQLQGSVVTGSDLFPGTSTLDGFTIIHGSATNGGGVSLSSASPTIANNSITGNTTTSHGGGVYMSSSSPVIVANTIMSNSATYRGGGLYMHGKSSPTITNNKISGNSAALGGGLIVESFSSPTIANNSIVANNASSDGGGLYLGWTALLLNDTILGNSASGDGGGVYTLSSSTIINTLVAFNSSGIHSNSPSTPPALRQNCVYGNGAYEYSGLEDPTGSNGNIAVDPGLADFAYGGWHLELSSPCVDAGSNDDAFGSQDLDGQPRVLPAGGSIDIGADESDGAAPPYKPHAVVHVSPVGDDGQDGCTWASAKRTVQAGIDAAAALGGEVWVHAGTYKERIRLRSFAHLYGGFIGDELAREEREWTTNVTVLDGQQQGSVVTGLGIAAGVSTLDGFTITHGSSYGGAGIYLRYASPTIANNTITHNGYNPQCRGGGLHVASESTPLIIGNTIANNDADDGGGLYLTGNANPVIRGNTIIDNTVGDGDGGGLYMSACSPMITYNIIERNKAANGAGMCLTSDSSPTIASNTLRGNEATLGGGIRVSTGSPLIAYNLLLHNIAQSGAGLSISAASPAVVSNAVMDNVAYVYGGGMDVSQTASPIIANNTIIRNLARRDGGGMSLRDCTVTIANTLVAYNSSGVYGSGASPSLHNNCVYANAWYSFAGMADPTGADGNISVEPAIGDIAYGGWHLEPGSPCVDAGSNSDVLGDLDLDGQARIQALGGVVDIGADESDGTLPSLEHAIVRVSVLGDDAHDGTSWALAKRTVQAGINSAAAQGGEVWVRAGTYAERITLEPLTHVYGGFAGDELTREARDWGVNATTLDGELQGSVVTGSDLAPGVCTLDGLTLTRGDANKGGGVQLSWSFVSIAHCTIAGNWAYSGAGAYIALSAPTIRDCAIRSNESHSGGGVFLTGSAPRMSGNTITENIAEYAGGGVFVASSSAPAITNDKVATNTALLGGGLYIVHSYPTVSVSVIANNSAGAHGGGLYLSDTSATVDGCIVVGNTVASRGGGIFCEDCSPTVTRNVIESNSAILGGGMLLSGASPTIANNVVANNQAESGGGLYLESASSPTIVNNSISANSASAAGGGLRSYGSSPVIANTLVAFNSSGISQGNGGLLVLRHNCVYGNTAYDYDGLASVTGANGNIAADPLFRDADGADGDPNTYADNDYRLAVGSPCIDAGENARVPADAFDMDGDGDMSEPLPFDLDGLPRFVDDPNTPDCPWAPGTCGAPPIVDMGAYEFHAGLTICPGDVNCDGVVSSADVDPFVARLGCPGRNPPACDTGCPWQSADINADGAVTFADIDPFVARLGSVCP